MPKTNSVKQDKARELCERLGFSYKTSSEATKKVQEKGYEWSQTAKQWSKPGKTLEVRLQWDEDYLDDLTEVLTGVFQGNDAAFQQLKDNYVFRLCNDEWKTYPARKTDKDSKEWLEIPGESGVKLFFRDDTLKEIPSDEEE